MTRSPQMIKTYGENVLALTKESIWKWANYLLERATDLNADQYPGRILPALFCMVKYINDAKYVPDDQLQSWSVCRVLQRLMCTSIILSPQASLLHSSRTRL